MSIVEKKNYPIFYGFVILMMATLACNATINTKTKQAPTPPPPTLEVFIPPTGIPASATPTEEIVELPTEVPPTEVIIPSATKKVVRNTPTRTVQPPTATKIPVVRQSTRTPTEVSYSDGDITVTAATGNLFVRRGPGTAYNIVSGFSKGVTTKAVGRNEKNDWLAIEIPLAKGTVGWISLGTGYTELHGNLSSLPLYPYEEPKPAYVQNCTLHDMTTRPGQWNLPAKTTQKVSPGEYQFLDVSTGQSKVLEATLKEGNTVYIKVDGDGTSHSCP